MWLLDRWINNKGIAASRELVDSAIRMNETHKKFLMDEAREFTGLDNPNSPLQLRRWLSTVLGDEGLEPPSVTVLLSRDIIAPARRILEIWQALGKTSVKKYETMRDSMCSDGRIHDLFQFYGAQRTGRFAGRNAQL